MPACMTYLMSGLNEKHHLKHFGRLQLGLFLKGAGLSLNEALTFWQQKFSKTTADDFKKKYDYNIRHNYGRLGKQVDYVPMSCQKIIQVQPLSDEYHGCPYKTLESKKLKALLKLSYNISDEDFLDIEQKKKEKQYQVNIKQSTFNISDFINLSILKFSWLAEKYSKLKITKKIENLKTMLVFMKKLVIIPMLISNNLFVCMNLNVLQSLKIIIIKINQRVIIMLLLHKNLIFAKIMKWIQNFEIIL